MNPHFIYKTVVYPEVIHLHKEYEKMALKILNNATPYPTNIPYLTEDEVREITCNYL